MYDDTTFTGLDDMEATDSSLMRTYTQVVSCVVGSEVVERRRQSLRAQQARDHYKRKQALENSFVTTIRNLFKVG